MEITEVRVKLVSVKNDKLRAFCSITVDNDFVIRDLKVIEGAKGAFVAMPSRKLTERCPRCSGKNHYRARYCNDCGSRLGGGDRGGRHEGGGQKMHTDIAHPINSRCREVIQKRVLEVYQEEVGKSGEPGYKPMELEVFDEESFVEESVSELGAPSDGGPIRAERRPRSNGGHQGGHQGGEAREGHVARSEEKGDGGPRPEGREEGRGRGLQERGRGRFSRGGFRGPREGGRERDQRRPNGGGGHGAERGGERREAPEVRVPLERDRLESDSLAMPERDRESFLSSRPPAPAASENELPAAPPARERAREEPETEPEDNFGAGLFN